MLPSKTRTVEIELQGSLCGAQALLLTEKLPVSELARAERVLLSLRGVDDADAAGLALLVRLHSQLRARGATLGIVAARRNVRELLDRIGLAPLLLVSEPANTNGAPYMVAVARGS